MSERQFDPARHANEVRVRISEALKSASKKGSLGLDVPESEGLRVRPAKVERATFFDSATPEGVDVQGLRDLVIAMCRGKKAERADKRPQKIEELEKILESKEKTISICEERLSIIGKSNQILEARVAELARLATESSELRALLAAEKEKSESFSRKFRENEESGRLRGNLEAQFDTMVRERDSLREETRRLKEKLTEAEVREVKDAKELAEAKQAREAIEAKHARETKELLEGREAQLGEARREIERLTSKASELESKISSVEREAESLRQISAEKTELETKLQSERETVGRLTDHLSSAMSAVRALNERRAPEIGSRLEGIEQALREAEDKILTLEAEKDHFSRSAAEQAALQFKLTEAQGQNIRLSELLKASTLRLKEFEEARTKENQNGAPPSPNPRQPGSPRQDLEELARFKARIQILEAEKRAMTRELEAAGEIRVEWQNLKAMLESVTNSRDEIEARLAENIQQSAQLTTQLEEARAQALSLRAKKQSYKKELTIKKSIVQQLQEKLEALNEKLTSPKQIIADSGEEAEDEETHGLKVVVEPVPEIDLIRSEFEEMKDLAHFLTDEKKVLTEKIATLERALTESTNTQPKITSDPGDSSKKILELSEKLESERGNVKDLVEKVEELEKRNQELIDNADALQMSVDWAKESCTQSDVQLEQLRKQLEDERTLWEKQTSAWKKDLEESQIKIEKADEELEKQNQELKIQLEEKESAILKIRNELASSFKDGRRDSESFKHAQEIQAMKKEFEDQKRELLDQIKTLEASVLRTREEGQNELSSLKEFLRQKEIKQQEGTPEGASKSIENQLKAKVQELEDVNRRIRRELIKISHELEAEETELADEERDPNREQMRELIDYLKQVAGIEEGDVFAESELEEKEQKGKRPEGAYNEAEEEREEEGEEEREGEAGDEIDDIFANIPPEQMALIQKAIEEIQGQLEEEAEKRAEAEKAVEDLSHEVKSLRKTLKDLEDKNQNKLIIRLRHQISKLEKEEKEWTEKESQYIEQITELQKTLEEYAQVLLQQEGAEEDQEGQEDVEAEEDDTERQYQHLEDELEELEELAPHEEPEELDQTPAQKAPKNVSAARGGKKEQPALQLFSATPKPTSSSTKKQKPDARR